MKLTIRDRVWASVILWLAKALMISILIGVRIFEFLFAKMTEA